MDTDTIERMPDIIGTGNSKNQLETRLVFVVFFKIVCTFNIFHENPIIRF